VGRSRPYQLASSAALVLGVTFAACFGTSPSTVTAEERPVIPAHDLVDSGDFYWSDGRQVRLLRVAGELVVRLAPATDVEAFVRDATSSQGVLAGFERTATLDETTISFGVSSRRRPAGEAIFDRVSEVAGVAWVAPVFFNSESGTRLFVTDEIVVALRADTVPDQVFDADFSRYRRLAGTPDQFVVTVAAGGGVHALAAATRLSSIPGVAWASPNFIQDFRAQRQE